MIIKFTVANGGRVALYEDGFGYVDYPHGSDQRDEGFHWRFHEGKIQLKAMKPQSANDAGWDNANEEVQTGYGIHLSKLVTE